MLIDEYKNWRADLHTCGRHLSESLIDYDEHGQPVNPDPDYQVSWANCRACMALDKALAEQGKKDEPLVKAGRSPNSWRLPQVVPLSELPPEFQFAVLDARERRRNAPSVPFPVSEPETPVHPDFPTSDAPEPQSADYLPGVADG